MEVEATPPATVEEVCAEARRQIGTFKELHALPYEQLIRLGQQAVATVTVGCSVDLSEKNLSTLPEVLVETIKHETQRLALNKNNLSGLPNSFAGCACLKFLVLRHNSLRDFPRAILGVGSLETLDLKDNRLQALPEDLSRLKNLRVIDVGKNKIQKLPLCIGSMEKLVQISTRKNPIVYPPRQDWESVDVAGDNDSTEKDNARQKERLREETRTLKKLLSGFAAHQRGEAVEAELSEGNVETPRPTRRKASGRFPIRPSVSGLELSGGATPTSPKLAKPPPVPVKSFQRVVPHSVSARPQIAPLVNHMSERYRSNSESQMSTSTRNKRRGWVSKRIAESNQPADPKSFRMSSHLRGLSHGSALQSNAFSDMVTDSSGPPSPVESVAAQPAFVRRLSSLPEGKRKSRVEDPHVEAASGLVYAFVQIQGPLEEFASIVQNNLQAETPLDSLVPTTFELVRELNVQVRDWRRRSLEVEEDDRQRMFEPSAEGIRVLSQQCIKAFIFLSHELQQHSRLVVMHADRRHIRTLMHLLFASMHEIRIATTKLESALDARPQQPDPAPNRGRQSPSDGRPSTSIRVGAETPLSESRPNSRSKQRQDSRRFFESGDSQVSSRRPSYDTEGQDDNSFDPLNAFPPSVSYRLRPGDNDEEALFHEIFGKLLHARDAANQLYPTFLANFFERKRTAELRMAGSAEAELYESSCEKCRNARDATSVLDAKLVTFNVRDPIARNQIEFWQCCNSFTKAYYMCAAKFRELSHASLLPTDAGILLRKLHAAVKDVSHAINNSPWAHLAIASGQTPSKNPSSASLSQLPNSHPAYNVQQFPNSSYTPNIHSSFASSKSSLSNLPPHGFSHSYQNLQPYQLTSKRTASGGSRKPNIPALQTRTSGLPGPNPLDPLSSVSAVSSQGSLGSGYVTPLPATPLSAALGPAAGATVPLNGVLSGITSSSHGAPPPSGNLNGVTSAANIGNGNGGYFGHAGLGLSVAGGGGLGGPAPGSQGSANSTDGSAEITPVRASMERSRSVGQRR